MVVARRANSDSEEYRKNISLPVGLFGRWLVEGRGFRADMGTGRKGNRQRKPDE